MDPSKILKFARLFEMRIKKASIRGNMAKRVLFSLLSHLVPATEQARVALTKGVVDYNALRQLIPGAKELLKYGLLACLNEVANSIDKEDLNNLQALYNAGNYIACLQQMKSFFDQDDPYSTFGGPLWSKTTEALLQITNSLADAQNARKSSDWESEAEALMNVVVYMNVLEGLAHNSGMLMDKIQDIEKQEAGLGEEWEENLNDRKKTKRLMDVKELKDPDDVLKEILPILEKETDAPLTMKDWMHKARQRRHIQTDTDIQEKLRRISGKKRLMSLINVYNLQFSQKDINSLLMMPDNRAAEEFKRRINSFLSFIRNIPMMIDRMIKSDTDLLPPDVTQTLLAYQSDIKKYTKDKLNHLINNYEYYEIRQYLTKQSNFISYIINAVESIEV